MQNLHDAAHCLFHCCHTQSTPAIIGSPCGSPEPMPSLPALPIPPPAYQITPYPSTIESFMSTHEATDGALSGNISRIFDSNADEDRFEHFTSTPSLYQPFPNPSPHLSVSSISSSLHPDIQFLVWRIYYKGEDFIAQLNKQYSTGVIPGTELFIEDLVVEAHNLIPPVPTPPPSHPSSPLSFVTYNSGKQRQGEAEETLTQYSPSTSHPSNATVPASM